MYTLHTSTEKRSQIPERIVTGGKYRDPGTLFEDDSPNRRMTLLRPLCSALRCRCRTLALTPFALTPSALTTFALTPLARTTLAS